MIQKIVNWMKQELDKRNIKENSLYNNEFKVYYYNGNDGTAFDWACNSRLCEFFVFSYTEYGLLKLFITKEGVMEMYIYDLKEPDKYEIVTKNISASSAYKLKLLMEKKADNLGLYDKTLQELGIC